MPMLDDFTPIIHHLDGRTIKVWAVGDVHIGSKSADIKGFKDFLDKIAADDDSFVCVVGDILNNCTRSSISDIYEETMPPSAQIELAAELLEPVKDKILGCVGGNHERRSRRETDLNPLYDVFVLLGKRELFRENLCFIRVILERGKTKNRYSLLLAHGKTENKKRHFAYSIEGVDAFITGHTHNGLIEKPAKIVFGESNKVTIRPIVSLTAASWLGYSGYAANSLMLAKATSDPQALVLEFSGSNARHGNMRVAW